MHIGLTLSTSVTSAPLLPKLAPVAAVNAMLAMAV